MSADNSQSRKVNYSVIKQLSSSDDEVLIIVYRDREMILKISNSSFYGLRNPCELDLQASLISPAVAKIHSTLPRTKSSLNKGFGMTMTKYPFDMNEYLRTKILTWNDKVKLTLRLISAVERFHEINVLHLDIKPQNIVFDDDIPVFIDFGYSRKIDKSGIINSKTMFATIPYAPPEILNPRAKILHYTKAVDWWGLALTIYWVLTEKLIYSDMTFWNDHLQTYNFLITKFDTHEKRIKIFFEGLSKTNFRYFPRSDPLWVDDDYKKEIRNQTYDLADMLAKMTDKNPKKRLNGSQMIKLSVFKPFQAFNFPSISLVDIPRCGYKLPEKFEDDVSKIIDYYVEVGEFSTRSLYLSVDILYRSIYLMLDVIPELRYVVRRFLGAAAIWIGVSYDFWYNENIAISTLKHYDLDHDSEDRNYFKQVIDAVMSSALGGIIMPDFLFEWLHPNQFSDYVYSHLLIPEVYSNIKLEEIKNAYLKNPTVVGYLTRHSNPRVSEIININLWKGGSLVKKSPLSSSISPSSPVFLDNGFVSIRSPKRSPGYSL